MFHRSCPAPIRTCHRLPSPPLSSPPPPPLWRLRSTWTTVRCSSSATSSETSSSTRLAAAHLTQRPSHCPAQRSMTAPPPLQQQQQQPCSRQILRDNCRPASPTTGTCCTSNNASALQLFPSRGREWQLIHGPPATAPGICMVLIAQPVGCLAAVPESLGCDLQAPASFTATVCLLLL